MEIKNGDFSSCLNLFQLGQSQIFGQIQSDFSQI